jgi:hypothetical protein
MVHATLKDTVPVHVRRRAGILRRRLGEAAAHPDLALSQLPLVGGLIATAVPAMDPPILVTGLPRSGSSWVGSILGASPASLYLREPMTQSYLNRIGRQNSPFFEWDVCKDGRAYDRFAALAFRAIPRFDKTIVAYPEQWRFPGRKAKRVVVKDVNPLVIGRLWQRFRPRIVFLVRHPVAVSRSFHALGWTGDQFRTRFTAPTLARFLGRSDGLEAAGFWEAGGAFQAMTQNLAMAALSDADHLVVRYEDVCREPLGAFERMFAFCELPFSRDVREAIEGSSRTEAGYAPGSYDTVRDSGRMHDRWRRDVDAERIAEVRRGYFACRPIFYRDRDDW